MNGAGVTGSFPHGADDQAPGKAGVMGRPGQSSLSPAALIFIVLVLLVAAGTRLVYLQHLRNAPDFASPVLDPQLNDYWARALVTGDWTPPPGANDPLVRTTPYGRPPGYPWFLAGVYRLFGLDPIAPRLAQMALGLLTIFLSWLIAWRLYGAWAGGTAALLLACTWPLPYFEGELNSPALECACLAIMVAGIALPGRHRYRWISLVLAGLAAGWLVITRPNALVPVALAAGWLAWTAEGHGGITGRHHAAGRGRFLSAAVFCAGVLLCVGPVVIRNRVVGGEWTPISYYGGVNLYIGNHPDSTGDRPRIPDIKQISGWEGWNCFDYPHMLKGLAERQGLDGSFGSASRWFAARALENWWHYPGKMLRLTWRKALLFWGPAIVSDSKEVALERQQDPWLSLMPGFPLVAGVGLVGMVLAPWSRRCRDHPGMPAFPRGEGLLVLLVLGYFLSVLPFFMAERYRVPVMVPLALLAGGAVERFRGALRTRNIQWAVWTIVLLAAGVTLTHLPLAAYEPDEARWHFHRGIALLDTGRPVAAVVELQCAVSRDPAHTWSWLYLASAYEQMGRLEDALAACRRAVDLSDWPDAWNNLGWILYRQRRLDEAEQALLEATRRNPGYRKAWENLTRVRLEKGDLDGAEMAARQVSRLAPADPDAWNNLGWTLQARGRLDEARAAYERAMALDPAHAAARSNLERLGQLEGNVPGQRDR